VRLPARVSRVVTLAPNLTEIAFAIGAGEKIVGTDDYSNEPVAARTLPKVGGLQPNIEKIITLRPDLVLATTSGNHPTLPSALAAAGVPLFVLRTDRLDQIPAAMIRLGGVLGVPRASDSARLVAEQIARERRRRRRPPRLLFTVWADPLYVAGRQTFSGDLMELTGAQNSVHSRGWPQYSMESLTESPPDVMLFPGKSVSRAQCERLLASVPGLKERITIVEVDEDRFTRPGPRVGEAARDLNRILDQWERARR